MRQNIPKTSAPPKKFNPKDDSFLEVLRGIGGSALSSTKNDLVKPGMKDIFDSLSPFGKPQSENKSSHQEDSLQRESLWENRYRLQRRQLETLRREEKVVFTRQERETQVQVKTLQDEIKQLATATGQLAKEAQVATMQEETSPGTYHLNFLQRLLSLVRELRKQVQESSFWLASWNKKAQKKNFYWSQFKKSGSSFSLHHDRSVATQAG